MGLDPLGTNPFSQASRLGRYSLDNQYDIARTVERLSSGLRVNRAADDPSGSLRINGLQADLIGNRQAIENTQDAGLMSATATEGAKQILSQLERMREIATLSLDKTTSEIDRDKLQKELRSLSGEIDRIARSTEFNGRYLLDGSSSAFKAAQTASSRTLINNRVTDAVSGLSSSFFSQIGLDPDADSDTVFEFRLFNDPNKNYTSLEVSASNQGIIRTYDYYLDMPTALSLPLTELGGPGLNVNRTAYQEPARTPLTASELNTPLQALTNQGRIDQVSYGNLALTAGGQVFSNVLSVTANTTINDVLSAIDNLSGPNGAFSASYNSGTGRISVGFTGTGEATAVNNTSYTPAVPGQAGGAFDAFALITPPPDGPAYRNPDSFLPAPGFAVGSAQSYFPTLSGNVSADVSFAGSNSSLLTAFGINSQSGRGNMTGYNTSYYGETVATGGQSEYVNRTRVTIDDVTAQQAQTGLNTGLTAADADETFRVLNTAVIDANNFSAGDFSIDFGANNGTFTFAGFDPAVHGIDEIVTAINTFKPGYVSASFDAGSDTLTISNTPQPTAIDSKVDDPGLGAGGSFSIDFGSNGTFNFNLQPGSSTIQNFVTALNAHTGVSASFDADTDQLSIDNTVTPSYQARVIDPGLSPGTFSIDFGSNGVYNFAFNPASQNLQDLIDDLNGFKPGFVTASYDASTDRFSISNTAAPITEVKAYSPSALAGSFDINFGENGNFNFNFDPATHSIQSVVNAINTFKPGFVTASYDESSDQLSISNTSSTGSTLSASKVANPPLNAGTFSIDFGSNGVFNLANPQNLTIQGFVNAINGYGATVDNRVSATYDEASDQISISNTPLNGSLPSFDTKIDNPGFGTGTFAIDFGSNGVLNLGTVNGANMTIDTLVGAINNYTGAQPGGDVWAVWDGTNDRLVINNTSVDTVSSVTNTIGYKIDDPGIGNSHLVIDFGANGVFTSSRPLGEYTLNQIVAEINGAGGGNYRALYDLGTDSIRLTNDTTDIATIPGTPGDYKVGTGGLGGFSDMAGQLTYKVQSQDGSNIDVWESFSGNLLDATISEIVDFLDYGTIYYPGLFDSAVASYDEGADQLSINVTHFDIPNPSIALEGADATAFRNFFKLPGGDGNVGPGQPFASLMSTGSIDNGGQGSNGDISGSDVSSLTLRQLLTNTYGGTPPTPGTAYDNKIELLSPGANALFKISDAVNNNTNPDFNGDNSNITFGANMDNEAIDSRLNLSDDDYYNVLINALISTPVTETITTTTPGNNRIQFLDFGTGVQSTLKITDVANTGTGTQTAVGLDIDKGGLHPNLNISEPGDLGRTFNALATTPELTTSTVIPGNNQISINDGGTGVEAFFRLSGAIDTGSGTANSVSSTGDIDRSSTSALLDVNGSDVSGKTLNQLATEQINYSGTPAGNNQISFSGSSNLQSFFRLSDRASTGTGGTNSVDSADDIDKSSSTGYAQLDISLGDVTGATIGSLQSTGVFLSGGDNSITFSGSTGLQTLLKLNDVSASGSGTRTAISSADIDQSNSSALLDISSGDVNSLSFQNLISQPLLTSGGDSNAITFSAGLGEQVRDFFKLSDQPDNSPVTLGSNSYTQTTLSSAAIDNGATGSAYDISSGDVTGASFQSLTTVFPSGPVNNQIIFGGVNGANIRNVFNLNDVASDGTFGSRTSTSTSAIDRGDLDSSLELDNAEVTGSSLSQLLTPRLSTLVTGPLVIDGNTVITINPDTTTLNQVIGAINSYTGPNNKTYNASFSAGQLSLTVTDRENLSPTGSALAANPNDAAPRLNGNELVFDSAAYVASTAPKTVGGVALNPTGTGPAEQALSTGALDSRYSIVNPAAPADLSSISWGGTSNIASILYLGNVGSGNVSGPTVIQDEYQGVISSTGVNSYNLEATNRRQFEASSASTSSQIIGRNKDRIGDNELGVVVRIQTFAEETGSNGNALGFQLGEREGDTLNFGFADLTAQSLRIETLNLVGENTDQTRRHSINAFNVIEKAIQKTLTQTSRLGAFQLSVDSENESLASQREALTGSLEAWQNTDITSDVRELTRQQLVAQTGNIALSQNFSNTQRLFDALFDALPGSDNDDNNDDDNDTSSSVNPATFAEERRRELQDKVEQGLQQQLARTQADTQADTQTRTQQAQALYGLSAENQI